MNVEQMSVADLLREGKQAMALALGVVGPDTQARWAAVAAEIDLRLSVGDIDESGLFCSDFVPEWRLQTVIQQRDKAIAERDRAYQQIRNNATNLQFVQEAFNSNHPALVGELGSDLSRGAFLLWDWNRQIGKGLLQEDEVVPRKAPAGKVECCICDGTGVRPYFPGNGYKRPNTIPCGLCKGTGWMTPPPKKP